MSQGLVCAGSHTSVAALVKGGRHDADNLVRSGHDDERAADRGQERARSAASITVR